ncbi:MAG: class I SAM-dependent methyltransferase [Actinomycetota bacterium]|nr:class I SAM-dependent methyltransferase [Actinomycetota bacterium]MDQ2956525.1 class I SAM-dependent methyltransferase [Actinomycetota bacterium]
MADLAHLNDLYGKSEDPWHMRGDWQAERRRDLLLASLNHARYGNTFVPGCGGGELLTTLARRTDQVLAADDNRAALAEARTRTSHLSNVDIQWLQLPGEWPHEQSFDLIVLHEMGYLMDLANWAALAEAVRGSLLPDATVLACHRHPDLNGRLLQTDTLHGTLDSILGLTRQTQVFDSDFAIDVWTNRVS